MPEAPARLSLLETLWGDAHLCFGLLEQCMKEEGGRIRARSDLRVELGLTSVEGSRTGGLDRVDEALQGIVCGLVVLGARQAGREPACLIDGEPRSATVVAAPSSKSSASCWKRLGTLMLLSMHKRGR